jgi:hypothetical protein
MAAVISLALMLLFGIIEYARFVYFMHVADSAAREAARFAVVHTGDGTTVGSITDKTPPNNPDGTPNTSATVCGVANYTINGADSNLVPGTYQISVYNANPSTGAPISGTNWNDGAFGGAIAVQVKGTFKLIVPSLLQFSSGNIPVTVTAMMSSEAN